MWITGTPLFFGLSGSFPQHVEYWQCIFIAQHTENKQLSGFTGGRGPPCSVTTHAVSRSFFENFFPPGGAMESSIFQKVSTVHKTGPRTDDRQPLMSHDACSPKSRSGIWPRTDDRAWLVSPQRVPSAYHARIPTSRPRWATREPTTHDRGWIAHSSFALTPRFRVT